MRKLLLFAFCLAFVSTGLRAQVTFSINLLSDQETYLVSMHSEETIDAPMNMSSNVQVVLKTPFGNPLIPVDFESLISGIDWTDNAFLDAEMQNEDYTLIAFVMVQSTTKEILFEAGVETPLFTFKNMDGECVGEITLPDNDDPIVKHAVSQGFNFTQSITVLSKRKNAFIGVENGVADCSDIDTRVDADPIIKNLKAFPVPANDQLTIEWTNLESYQDLDLEIFSANGQLIKKIELDASQGDKEITLEVLKYWQGLYNFRLKSDKGYSPHFKFILVR